MIVVWDFWGWQVLKGSVCVCWYLLEVGVAKEETEPEVWNGQHLMSCRKDFKVANISQTQV